MATVREEFNFGYALFKSGNVDSASVLMKKSLTNGHHFNDMGQIRYWENAGVFKRMAAHKSMSGIADLLESNTRAYENPAKMDSSLREQLLTAYERDQRFRGTHLDSARQQTLDIQNQKFLMDVIKTKGWPGEDRVGYDGANAAFLVAQHSDNDIQFQQECLNYIHHAFYAHKIDASSYAYIIDRTRVNSGKPQLFGTQIETSRENGELKLTVKPVEDENYLDLRRKVFGLPPIAVYLESVRNKLRTKN